MSGIIQMGKRCRQNYLVKLAALLILFRISYTVPAQIFPVQVTTQLIPPYSVYLSDYATSGNEKLRVILLQRDLSQPSYQLRLVMSVVCNGKEIMRTSRSYNPGPINLNPGIPTIVSGAELAPYLNSYNIDFVGYSRELYDNTKALPEGGYEIRFTAYDYRRQDVQVSNAGASFYYLAKSEPPLVNFPACGTTIAMRTPQQIIFSWLPRNTASPNSVTQTVYEFALYETRPEGRNPNDVVLSTQPVFRTTTPLTQLVYGPTEPLLLEGYTYVWRVRAVDEGGRDAFRNNGYSEVCTFVYGGIDPLFNIGAVQDLQALGETERRAKITWTPGDYDSYKIFYRKTGNNSYEWFSSEVTDESIGTSATGELKLFGLEPDTEYETRVQAKKSGVLGPYTDVVVFRTREVQVAQCGDPAQVPDLSTDRPYRNATSGTIIDVDGINVTLVDVVSTGQDGWYKGYGRMSASYLGGASFMVKFDNLFINDNLEAGLGRIDVVTKGVAAMIAQQLEAAKNKQKEEQQEENRAAWEGTGFYENVFLYNAIVISSVTVDDSGNLVITDEQGQMYTNTKITEVLADMPELAVIVQDKNGDQWVVQKDEATKKVKVTKVKDGGLTPGQAQSSETVAQDTIKQALLSVILADFKNELATWLREHGKGPLDDETLALLMALPACFPEDGELLKHIHENTIPYFESNIAELQQKAEADQANKELFENIAESFTGKNFAWESVSEEDQLAAREATCKVLLAAARETLSDLPVYFIDDAEMILEIPREAENVPEYYTFITPSGHPITLYMSVRPSLTGRTSNDWADSRIPKGVLLAFQDGDNRYTGAFRRNGDDFYFLGYKLKGSEDNYYQGDNISSGLPATYKVIVARENDDACTIDIGVASYPAKYAVLSPETSQPVNTSLDISSLNPEYKSLGYKVAACHPPLTITHQQLLQQGQVIVGAYSGEGILFALDQGGVTRYIYLGYRDDLTNYFLQWDGTDWQPLEMQVPIEINPVLVVLAVWGEMLQDKHMMLDAVGSIPVPVIGEAADALNGVIYFMEGDDTGAYISLAAAALPVVGEGFKYTLRAAKAVIKGKKIILYSNEFIKEVDNVFTYLRNNSPISSGEFLTFYQNIYTLTVKYGEKAQQAFISLAKNAANKEGLVAAMQKIKQLEQSSPSSLASFFDDVIGNAELAKGIANDGGWVDVWRVLGESADLRKNIDALETIEYYTTNVNSNVDELTNSFRATSNKEDWFSGIIAEIRSKARSLPGVSSGNGIAIDGKWMRGTEGNAGLFPKSIADKLKGQNFKDFDEFRSKFWKAAADDPDLVSQFNPVNQSRMRQGLAPRVAESQQLGDRISFEIHHKTPIHDGGAVYDMDNMVIVTPRYHKEILDPAYHFNK